MCDIASQLNSFVGMGLVQLVGLSALIVVIIISMVLFFLTIRYPANLPRVREHGKTRFSLSTRWAYYTDSIGLFREAYENVGSKVYTPFYKA
jgi:hypothetical protein